MENKQTPNLFDLLPERKREFVKRDDGMIEVLIPRYGRGRLGKFLGSLLKDRPVRLKLDKVGTLTWELCDGRHSVFTIGERLRKSFGEEVDPVYDRLELFLKHMKRRDLISWRGGPSGAKSTQENVLEGSGAGPR